MVQIDDEPSVLGCLPDLAKKVWERLIYEFS